MRGDKRRPSYDLEYAKQEVVRGNTHITNRATNSLTNHGHTNIKQLVQDVFQAITSDTFDKSTLLEYAKPGTYADVYKGVYYDNEEWYVKFYIDEDGANHIEILSLKPDGSMY